MNPTSLSQISHPTPSPKRKNESPHSTLSIKGRGNLQPAHRKPKILTLSQAIIIRRKAGREGRTVVFTNGVFDLLHRGHVDYLQRARALGDILILGLNTDASTRQIKGFLRPLTPQNDRAAVLSALECVDYIVSFSDDTPARLIARLLPDILVKGADYQEKDIVGADAVKARGGRVVRMNYLKGYSTTSLIQAILKRYQKRQQTVDRRLQS